MLKKINLYKNAFDKRAESYDIDSFLLNVKSGNWQDAVLQVRIAKSKEQKDAIKKSLPCVTVSGTFGESRRDTDIKEHSNHIALDFDQVENLNAYKDILNADPYTYCVFVSCSGGGLCAIIKIDGKKHRAAFEGLQEYFYTRYGLVVDPSGRNEARLRYVSYDPDIEVHEGSKVFKTYPEKRKPADVRNIYFGSQDVDHVFDQIQSRKVDITGNYHQWLSICFSICDHFGEAGRDRMHSVSQYSHLYDSKKADQQYNACIKHQAHAGKRNTIATFLYYAKLSGISIISDLTKSIVSSAKMGKNGSGSVESTIRALKDFDGISEEVSRSIVEQVYNDPKEVEEEALPLIIRLQKYWKEYQGDVRRNVINKKCYRRSVPLSERDLVDMYMDASKKLNASITKEMVSDMLKSSLVPEFNPLKDWFSKMANPTGGHMKKLAECLNPVQGLEYAEYIIMKWLMACVGTVFGQPSTVMLTLVGKQGKGKSHFFQNLLPPEFPFRDDLIVEDCLKKYSDQNNKLMMAQKWMVIDDEFLSIENVGEDGLKSAITTKNITLRLAYERTHETFPKLCNFVGTSNNMNFLKDMSGNRRFPIIETNDINRDLYNTIDKHELWKEAYFYYLDNQDERFTSSDFEMINDASSSYIERTPEQELLLKYFVPSDSVNGYFMTTTDILNSLQGKTTLRNLNSRKLGRVIASLDWKRCCFGQSKEVRYGYFVQER
jgi:hypothetical protein